MLRLRTKLLSRLRRWLSLRLRTKLSLMFALIALVPGLSIAAVTYSFARSSLLDQRRSDAIETAVANATRVFDRIDVFDQGALQTWLRENTSSDNLAQVVRPVGVYAAFPAADPELSLFPATLRDAVADRAAATQRFTYDGRPYIGVGMPSPDGVDDFYLEAFPLTSTERTLRTILLFYAIGSPLAVLVFGALGMWTGRRLLRPLGTVTTAAEEIAAGDLSTRVGTQPDRDLVPLVDAFNQMADAVQARIERESRFASEVSHELRSPITALQAATDVLEGRRDEFAERPRQAVDVIIDQVRRFDNMVLDLLELSRIDAGAADLHLEEVDLADAGRRIATRHEVGDTPIDVGDGATRFALVDRVRLERVLGNLLRNAKIHAGGPRRISIEADDDRGNGGEDAVLLAVEDDGPGVDEAERSKIFERFARGRASRHRVGTGLGLALVAEHAAALGGAVWVEDAPGGGARFVVRLRAAPPAGHRTETADGTTSGPAGTPESAAAQASASSSAPSTEASA